MLEPVKLKQILGQFAGYLVQITQLLSKPVPSPGLCGLD